MRVVGATGGASWRSNSDGIYIQKVLLPHEIDEAMDGAVLPERLMFVIPLWDSAKMLR